MLRVNSTILRASYCIPRLRHRFTAMFAMSFALQLLISALAFADEIRIPASKDNTLYQSDQGSVSNARGQHFFVGTNRQANVRRGVIAFDIAGNIPEGSVICDTRLTLSVSASHLAIGMTIDLRAALNDWGEGTSLALGTEGRGANATAGDATWLHTFWDTDFWSTPGGDFTPAPSASLSVTFTGSYTWSSEQMAADVQGWLDAPEMNFGWGLIAADESVFSSAKQFDSRENQNPSLQPVLTVVFAPPADRYLAGENSPSSCASGWW